MSTDTEEINSKSWTKCMDVHLFFRNSSVVICFEEEITWTKATILKNVYDEIVSVALK
jgi:hypothetical protein